MAAKKQKAKSEGDVFDGVEVIKPMTSRQDGLVALASNSITCPGVPVPVNLKKPKVTMKELIEAAVIVAREEHQKKVDAASKRRKEIKEKADRLVNDYLASNPFNSDFITGSYFFVQSGTGMDVFDLTVQIPVTEIEGLAGLLKKSKAVKMPDRFDEHSLREKTVNALNRTLVRGRALAEDKETRPAIVEFIKSIDKQ